LKISTAFAGRAFSAGAFQAAISNYSWQVSEESYQIFATMIFEISFLFSADRKNVFRGKKARKKGDAGQKSGHRRIQI